MTNVYRARCVLTGEIFRLYILKGRIDYITEAALRQERSNLSLIDPEHVRLAAHLSCPREHLPIALGCVVQDFVVDVVEDYRAVLSGMPGDKLQRAVDAFRIQEVGHALPNEQSLALLIVAAALQDLAESLGVEIGRDEGDVDGQRVDDFLQPLQLDCLSRRLVDLEHACAVDPWDAIGTCVKTRAQDTDLSNAFAELRFEVFVDISLSPDDEPNRSGRHAFIQAGFDEPCADGEHDAAGYQGACIGIGNDAIGFRFAHLDRTHPGYAFRRSADFCFSHISLRFYFRKRHFISIGSDLLTGNRLICSSQHFCGILRRAALTLLFTVAASFALVGGLFQRSIHAGVVALAT